jgi:hypothetical protein
MQRALDALQSLANPLGCCLVRHEHRTVHIALRSILTPSNTSLQPGGLDATIALEELAQPGEKALAAGMPAERRGRQNFPAGPGCPNDPATVISTLS